MNIRIGKSETPGNPRGLNLIEVTITIVIFTLITTALINVFNQGYRFMRKTRMAQTAYFLAQEKMEELLTNSVFLNGPWTHNETKQNITDFTDFQRQANFTCPRNGIYNLTVVNVTVYWQGQNGEQHFSLLSLVGNLTN